MGDLAADVDRVMRDIPDFPIEGILFKDITPVLLDPALLARVLDWMANGWDEVDVVVGMESRGFLFGVSLAQRLGVGFAPARKEGKLPYQTVTADYALEYGTATLQLHVDAVRPGQRVLVVDDLIATGGTARATVDLIHQLGGIVEGCLFLIELDFLKGRQSLDCPVRSLVHISG